MLCKFKNVHDRKSLWKSLAMTFSRFVRKTPHRSQLFRMVLHAPSGDVPLTGAQTPGSRAQPRQAASRPTRSNPNWAGLGGQRGHPLRAPGFINHVDRLQSPRTPLSKCFAEFLSGNSTGRVSWSPAEPPASTTMTPVQLAGPWCYSAAQDRGRIHLRGSRRNPFPCTLLSDFVELNSWVPTSRQAQRPWSPDPGIYR